ncbi:magnesium transporter [bacterium]|nr:magnesium transporter [candidate division CSSED10-310 bacterium]
MSRTVRQKRDAQVYQKIISRLLHAGAAETLQGVVAKLHPTDLAEALTFLTGAERRLLLPHIMKGRKLGWTLLEMHEDLRADLLQSMEDNFIARLVVDLPSDDASEIMNSLPGERIEMVLAAITDPFARRKMRHMLSYTPDMAGSMMQTEFLALPEKLTVNEAIAVIRRRYRDVPIFYLYTLDDEERLSGVVSFRQLLLAEEGQLLDRIAKHDVVKAHVDEEQAVVAQMVYRYDLLAIPVVDSKNRMVGIITVDDVMDVMEDEVSADIYKLAGSDAEEMVYGDRIIKISRIRFPWLLVSVGTGLLTAVIIGLFEKTLEAAIVLTAFIPVIAGMAGNIGTQSSAITVRGLAIGRLLPSNLRHIVWRELRVGSLLGVACGLLVGGIGSVWFSRPALGLVVGASMICGISFAATTGAFMPMVFARLNIDPAVASGPLVTTLNDCVSTIIYLSIASSLLQYIA